ncbi:saccharopine dehydrogenase family protein [Paenisporosarcina antarctica]|uniref:Saccharopine dehydrogenase n=1 Tax=Paenisporosarcina antarctica TaxID=417367 RepID=A0A4P7A0T8_9BACL|nr:saccharopine dehydrogenase C-terminal domain-containing protein [Paenisporosarcina antarctica]QBP42214.1 saccharopine dehydrogenase [Paenisporosarcina antarctica]
MKVVVLGAGLMGKEAARDLVNSTNVEKVFLADLQVEQVQAFKDKIKSDKIEAVRLDANNDAQLTEVMSKGDVVINALFYSFNEKVARIAVEIGVHTVDLGGHIGGATNAVLNLAEQAKKKGVTIIPDLGVAPGMINILTGYGASKLDEVKLIKLYVGGIPVEPEGPLKYNIVFSLEGVLDHYTDVSHVVRNGILLEIPSLTEIEPIHFDDFGELEAFHTAGGTSTLTKTFSSVETLEYKTIRYAGHAEKFKVLVDLGLTNKETKVDIEGKIISTRDVLKAALTPDLLLGDKQDAVLLRVIVSGVKNGKPLTYEYEMVTTKDMSDQVTAMARATANTISVVAQMIGNGEITKRGVFAPEQIVPGEAYIDGMKQRGVQIKETIH